MNVEFLVANAWVANEAVFRKGSSLESFAGPHTDKMPQRCHVCSFPPPVPLPSLGLYVPTQSFGPRFMLHPCNLRRRAADSLHPKFILISLKQIACGFASSDHWVVRCWPRRTHSPRVTLLGRGKKVQRPRACVREARAYREAMRSNSRDLKFFGLCFRPRRRRAEEPQSCCLSIMGYMPAVRLNFQL